MELGLISEFSRLWSQDGVSLIQDNGPGYGTRFDQCILQVPEVRRGFVDPGVCCRLWNQVGFLYFLGVGARTGFCLSRSMLLIMELGWIFVFSRRRSQDRVLLIQDIAPDYETSQDLCILQVIELEWVSLIQRSMLMIMELGRICVYSR